MPAATETVTETLQVMRHTVSPLKQKPSLGAVPWVVNAEPSDATQPEPPREVGINMKLSLLSKSVSSKKNEQTMGELDEIRAVVRDTYENIRESIDQLSTEPRNLPLIPTLTDYTTRFGEKNNIEIQSDFPSTFPQISPVAELQLLRIAQESLTNVRRHAQATKVAVKLESDGREVWMMIKDNGQGFTLPGEAEAQPGHHGLSMIIERAELLGGSVDISTVPGEGTEIKINLPIEKVRF